VSPNGGRRGRAPVAGGPRWRGHTASRRARLAPSPGPPGPVMCVAARGRRWRRPVGRSHHPIGRRSVASAAPARNRRPPRSVASARAQLRAPPLRRASHSGALSSLPAAGPLDALAQRLRGDGRRANKRDSPRRTRQCATTPGGVRAAVARSGYEARGGGRETRTEAKSESQQRRRQRRRRRRRRRRQRW
jgi:hypothetical protein